MSQRHSPRPAQGQTDRLPLAGGLALRRGRAHLALGPSRHAFAGLLMARSAGAVVWIGAEAARDRLHAAGLRSFADPGRLVLAEAGDGAALLWALKAALRSGAAPLVVADLPDRPPAVDWADLGLAAATARPAPLGLVLAAHAPDGTGAPDSAWRLAPVPAPGPDMALAAGAGQPDPHWRLDRLHAPDGPPARWSAVGDAAGRVDLTPLPG